jgi:hypothetical protein
MKLYRYDDDHLGAHQIILSEFNVRRHTPKGVWISSGWFGEKWVSLSGRKRYAYPTKEAAMDSFKIRKNKQLGHLERQLQRVKVTIDMLEKDETYRPNYDERMYIDWEQL